MPDSLDIAEVARLTGLTSRALVPAFGGMTKLLKNERSRAGYFASSPATP
jgi:hypothetical protein